MSTWAKALAVVTLAAGGGVLVAGVFCAIDADAWDAFIGGALGVAYIWVGVSHLNREAS